MAGAVTRGSVWQRLSRRTGQAADALWLSLRRPAVAIVLALLLLALLLMARVLPQIPGQAAADPASALRWLNAERDAWGAWGGFLRALGIFNVSDSPLFYILVALLAVVCGVHLAALLALARLPRQLVAALDAPAGLSPLPLDAPDGMTQLRLAQPDPPDAAAHGVRTKLEAMVGPVQECRLADDETRLLAMAGMRGLMLRPLLPAGALLALSVLWFTAIFGWNVRPPSLAPGESYTAPAHDIVLAYTLPAQDAGTLEVSVADASATLPAGAAQARVNGASVRVRAGAPALLLRTDAPILALPGAPDSLNEIGLVFPQPGSEQIVLLPASGTGVRIVRLPEGATGAFLVEVYARDGVQPVQRLELTDAQSLPLPLDTGDVALWIEPAVSLDVVVRSAPGGWLLWPALALVLAGLSSLLWRPVFALAQLRPWPVGRTVLTLQTSHRAVAAACAQPADTDASA